MLCILYTVDPPDNKHNMARNMQRNMKRYNKQVHQVGNKKSNITKMHGPQHIKITLLATALTEGQT